MSSTTTADSLKKTASEAALANEEPNAKKVKLNEIDQSATLDGKSVVDNNNETSASAKVESDENNACSTSDNLASAGANVPTKAANGNDKESKEEDLDSLDDDDSEEGEVEAFDPKIAHKLEEVEDIQNQISKLNELASEEILKVEQKFNKLRRPHFEKRNQLLKEIPNFWLTSLANHPLIAPMVDSAEDEDCLHYMVNLDVEEFEDIKSGYSLKLHFVENPYISNELIVKELRHLSSEEVVSNATPLVYKDTPQGKTLKQAVEQSIANYKRMNRPNQTQQSFFAWLTQPSESGTDDIAEIIKDQIWPSPLEFFFTTPDDYNGISDEEESDDDEEDYNEEIDNEVDPDMPDEELIDEELEIEEDDDDDDDDDDDEDDDCGNDEGDDDE